MDLSLRDEQQDFVAAIREFCERECGTGEKRQRIVVTFPRYGERLAKVKFLRRQLLPAQPVPLAPRVRTAPTRSTRCRPARPSTA